MNQIDINYVKVLLIEELKRKQQQYEETKTFDLVKEIEYIKELLERL